MENINFYAKSSDMEKGTFRKWLKDMLEFGPVTVDFLKADGEKRTMRCTLKDTPTYEKKTERKVNEEVCFCFDLDKNEWRSFRYDRITEIRLEI